MRYTWDNPDIKSFFPGKEDILGFKTSGEYYFKE
jgi:hypothetical protein